MKRSRDRRIGHMPLPPIEPRYVQHRYRPFIFLKALVIVGIVAGLAYSIFLINETALPIDFNRIDASGEDEVTQQGEIIFDVMPDEIKLEILDYANDEPKEFHVGAQGPQILIYHTHTREAYLETDVAVYNVGDWQTTQQTHSVIAVGEALKAELESYGFSVIHDMTDHVPPNQDTAYERSLQTMLDYRERYPTLRVFIDLHRDAYEDIEAGSKDFVTVNGEECARVMCVVGTDEDSSYESNYKLALALTSQLEIIKKGFTRPVRIKTGRYNHYNQQVSDMCLLIEMGHNANTLEQAKNAAKYAALAISRIVNIG